MSQFCELPKGEWYFRRPYTTPNQYTKRENNVYMYEKILRFFFHTEAMLRFATLAPTEY